MLFQYIKLLHHINPNMSIMEFADPGSLLADLKIDSDILDTSEYTVVCQSDETKANLQQSLADFPTVSYAICPAGRDVPEEDKEKADLVILSGLSAEFVGSAGLLLKKRGRVCLIEDAANAEAAETLLKNSGFLDLVRLEATTDKKQVFVATFDDVNSIGQEADREVVLILDFIPPAVTRVLEQHLIAALASRGYKTSTVVWGEVEVSTLQGKMCISLLELEQPFLEDLSEKDFDALKQFILNAASVMWVNGLDQPASSMMNGMARVIRNEVPGINLRTFNAPYTSLGTPERLAQIISRVFCSNSSDNEFLFKDDFIQVSRVVEDRSLNAEMDRLNPQNSKLVDNIPLRDAPGPLKLAIGTVGIMDTLCFERDSVPRTELKSDEIEIKVKATALK